jgi:hypothetical protein
MQVMTRYDLGGMMSTKLNMLCFLLIILNFVSCSASNYSTDDDKAWRLAKEKPLEIAKLPPNLTPRGPEPLRFPPSTFDWQPYNTSIVVHTALESHYQYEDKSDVFMYFNERSGLLLSFWLPYDHEILNYLSSNRIWVAFDLEEMRFNGELHFFEVKPDKKDKVVQNEMNFVWQPSPGVGVRTNQTANSVSIYIKSTDLYGRREPDNNMPSPRVQEQWSRLADSCKMPCYSKVFIWRPQLERFDTIQVELRYKGIEPPADNLPTILIGERR